MITPTLFKCDRCGNTVNQFEKHDAGQWFEVTNGITQLSMQRFWLRERAAQNIEPIIPLIPLIPSSPLLPGYTAEFQITQHACSLICALELAKEVFQMPIDTKSERSPQPGIRAEVLIRDVGEGRKKPELLLTNSLNETIALPLAKGVFRMLGFMFPRSLQLTDSIR